MSTKNLHGIIFNSFNYKENDLIVDVVCLELGFIQLYVKGGQKLTTKSFYILNMFNVIDFDINNHQQGLLNYRGGRIIKSFDYTKLSYNKMNVIMIISEILMRIKHESVQTKQLYLTLEKVLIDINTHKSDYDLLNLFLIEVLNIVGLSLKLDGCLYCEKSKDIVAYCWDNHGFVCSSCLSEDNLVYDKEVLTYLYKLNQGYYYEITENKKKLILRYLLQLLNDNAGIYLKSLKYLFKEDL